MRDVLVPLGREISRQEDGRNVNESLAKSPPWNKTALSAVGVKAR